jgi:hypothetical protein
MKKIILFIYILNIFTISIDKKMIIEKNNENNFKLFKQEKNNDVSQIFISLIKNHNNLIKQTHKKQKKLKLIKLTKQNNKFLEQVLAQLKNHNKLNKEIHKLIDYNQLLLSLINNIYNINKSQKKLTKTLLTEITNIYNLYKEEQSQELHYKNLKLKEKNQALKYKILQLEEKIKN